MSVPFVDVICFSSLKMCNVIYNKWKTVFASAIMFEFNIFFFLVQLFGLSQEAEPTPSSL